VCVYIYIDQFVAIGAGLAGEGARDEPHGTHYIYIYREHINKRRRFERTQGTLYI
jgi:hypothetical protein